MGHASGNAENLQRRTSKARANQDAFSAGTSLSPSGWEPLDAFHVHGPARLFMVL